ncbi:MAG TPA: cytochrome c [Pyrinomonadaceae bacterium]|nr:cytochrome c [Pyrinomonadaceae bacterium]
MKIVHQLAFMDVLILSSGAHVNKQMSTAQTPPNTTRVAALSAKKAKTLFKQYCVKCHGVGGRGETTQGEILGAPNFTESEWQDKFNDSRLINSIKHGRGEMPSFEKKLSQDQIKVLLAYVRAFRNDDQPERQH